MRGIFCVTSARTNEEYRRILKRRNLYLVFLMLLGAVIAAVAYITNENGTSALPDYIMGVYCGVGTGFVAAGLFLLIRNLYLLHNEEKLKESRLENKDERLGEIRSNAVNTAVFVTLAAVAVAGLIAGIFYPILIKGLIFVLYVFLISYVIAYFVYKKKL